MTNETEAYIRTILSVDDGIDKNRVERAIALIKGDPQNPCDLCRVISFKDAMKILEVKSPTLHGYIRKGYLTRVLGLGGRAIGINGNSLEAFRHRRIVHKGKLRQ